MSVICRVYRVHIIKCIISDIYVVQNFELINLNSDSSLYLFFIDLFHKYTCTKQSNHDNTQDSQPSEHIDFKDSHNIATISFKSSRCLKRIQLCLSFVKI